MCGGGGNDDDDGVHSYANWLSQLVSQQQQQCSVCNKLKRSNANPLFAI